MADPKKREIIIVTGMSGAGKSTAINVLEDFGYYVVDNLPCEIVPYFLKTSIKKVALGLDIRTFKKADELLEILKKLKEKNITYSLIYMDASDEVILNRYNLTRRKHPLEAPTLLESIQKERAIMSTFKDEATEVIDSSYSKVREFTEKMKKLLKIDEEHNDLNVHVMSFGFKYGIPIDADLLFDVRFLPNPYYIVGLKEKTGEDIEVKEYLESFEVTKGFNSKLADLLDFLIPNYIKEGKKHLTIALGCSGGRHRSVAVASLIYNELSQRKNLNVHLSHREKERGNW